MTGPCDRDCTCNYDCSLGFLLIVPQKTKSDCGQFVDDLVLMAENWVDQGQSTLWFGRMLGALAITDSDRSKELPFSGFRNGPCWAQTSPPCSLSTNTFTVMPERRKVKANGHITH